MKWSKVTRAFTSIASFFGEGHYESLVKSLTLDPSPKGEGGKSHPCLRVIPSHPFSPPVVACLPKAGASPAEKGGKNLIPAAHIPTHPFSQWRREENPLIHGSCPHEPVRNQKATQGIVPRTRRAARVSKNYCASPQFRRHFCRDWGIIVTYSVSFNPDRSE